MDEQPLVHDENRIAPEVRGAHHTGDCEICPWVLDSYEQLRENATYHEPSHHSSYGTVDDVVVLHQGACVRERKEHSEAVPAMSRARQRVDPI